MPEAYESITTISGNTSETEEKQSPETKDTEKLLQELNRNLHTILFIDEEHAAKKVSNALEHKKELISYGVWNPETAISSLDTLFQIHVHMGENANLYSQEDRENFYSLLDSNLEAIQRYMVDDSVDLLKDYTEAFVGSLYISGDAEEVNIGVKAIKGQLELADDKSSAYNYVHELLSQIVDATPDYWENGESERFKKLVTMLHDKEQDLRSMLTEMPPSKNRNTAIEVCLDVRCSEDSSTESWTDKILKGHEQKVLSYVMEEMIDRKAVPIRHAAAVAEYLEWGSKYTPDFNRTSRTWVKKIMDKYSANDAAMRNMFNNTGRLISNLESYSFAREVMDIYLYEHKHLDRRGDYLGSWMLEGSKDDLAAVVYHNLTQVHELENISSGIVGRLESDFGIHHFARYPVYMLYEQDRDKDDIHRPYGIMLTPDVDYNRALQNPILYQDFREDLNRMPESKYAFRIYESDSRRDILRSLKKTWDKYGDMSFAIIGAHGSRFEMQFGYSSLKIGDLENDAVVNTAQLSTVTPGRHKFFTPDATIVLLSCSTGKEIATVEKENPREGEKYKNIAEAYSKIFGVNVLAPKDDTSVERIIPKVSGAGLSFEVVYNSSEKSFYSAE